MSKYSTDIFSVLSAIDKKDFSFFEKLSEKEMKDISPFILMRWLSGTVEPAQIYLLNELVNSHVFSLQKHKELMIRLLMLCTDGKVKRYKWSKLKNTSNSPNCIGVIKEYFKYNNKEAKDALQLLSKQDILSYAEQLGRQDDELTKIRKELKSIKNE